MACTRFRLFHWATLAFTFVFQTRSSALRVATCTDGRPPYIQLTPSGKVEGFEVDFFNETFRQLKVVVKEDWPELVPWLETPVMLDDLILMTMDEVEDSLANGTVDIGFCALPRQLGPDDSNERFESEFDFLPVHLQSGIQSVIKSIDTAPVNFVALLGDIFSSFQDAYAQTALLVLLYFAILFAHVFWLLEGKDNGPFEDNYGPGIIDAIWFALVTALTVGYGDKVTSSLPGKIVALIWMVLGAYILGIFTAALTSAFVVSKLAGEEEVVISSVRDLGMYRVGVGSRSLLLSLISLAPGAAVQLFASESALLEAVVADTIDVAVLDERAAAFHTERKYHTTLQRTGPVFLKSGMAMGMSRVGEGGGEHPLYEAMKRVVVDLLAGPPQSRERFESISEKYFGAAFVGEEGIGVSQLERSLQNSNLIASCVLCGIAGLWSLSVGVHYRKEIKEQLVRARFMKALGLGKKYTLHQLRLGAGHLFDRHDRDSSGTLDLEEIMQLLRSMGKDVTLASVNKYIEREQEESRLESQGIVSMPSHADLFTHVPSPEAASAAGKKGKVVNVSRTEFVRVIEGIVMDQEEEEDEIEDLRQPCQRRHLLTFVGDIQTQVHDLQDKVDGSVSELHRTIASLNSRVDALISLVGQQQLRASPP